MAHRDGRVWTCLAFALTIFIFGGCQTTAVMEARPHTIAVWDLENLNPAELEGLELGELMAVKVIETLQASRQWEVVERESLILALEEQHLGSTALASEETRLRIGRLIGANFMVFGSYMKFMQTLQLNLRIVDVQSGRVVRAVQKTEPFKDIGGALKMADDAAGELFARED